MQRMAVMKYLLTHRTHPTVDEIYNDVVQEIPTLSKATVYNTLRLLVKQGAALQITINEQCTCYDGDITPHAHFFCRNCGRVYDMPLNWQDISEMADVPAGFKVDEAALFPGIVLKLQRDEQRVVLKMPDSRIAADDARHGEVLSLFSTGDSIGCL